MRNKDRGHIGSSFDAFLAEEGMLEECEECAIKELLAMQVNQAMKAGATGQRAPLHKTEGEPGDAEFIRI